MRVLIGFTFGIVIGLIAITHIVPEQTKYVTVHDTQVIEREILTTIDLDDLRQQIDELDQELYIECINVIAWHTDDPRAGIIQHVERHYEGDACRAADEAIRGEW